MSKEGFSEFVFETNLEGSGKASSYIKALEHLRSMLKVESFGFDDCIDIWNISSLKRLDELYGLVKREKERGKISRWVRPDIPSSYLEKGYCSAAITSYKNYLVLLKQENDLFDVYKKHPVNSKSLIKMLDVEPIESASLIQGMSDQEGKEVLRKTKVRLNQHIFRKMILDIYKNTCCISGLNIPQLNIASHIVPWAENKKTRLDPTNGLCLSATYDAAFDKKLISLDEDYRVIVSKEIKDYYQSEVIKSYFKNVEGKSITLPENYKPKPEYLTKHRETGKF